MKANHLIALMNKDVVTIVCKFEGTTKLYTYLALKEDNIKEGDLALIHNSEEYKVVKVVEVHEDVQIDTCETRRLKFIVQRVEVERYEFLCDNQLKAERDINRLEASRKSKEIIREYTESTGVSEDDLMRLSSSLTQRPALEQQA